MFILTDTFLFCFAFYTYIHTPTKSWLCPVLLGDVPVAVWLGHCRFISWIVNIALAECDHTQTKPLCLWTRFHI